MTDTRSEGSPTRRAALTVGGVAAAGAVAAVIASPSAAEAASGSALILGRANSANAGTTVSVASTSPALTVTNSGAAAFFKSTGSNGFAGGSASQNAYGLSAANYSGVQGGGGAVAADGGQNTGMIVHTSGNNRFAVNASYRGSSATHTTTGAGIFDGALADGVVGLTSGDATAGFAGVNGVSFSGGSGVFGQGGVGVLGYTDEDQGYGVWALADTVSTASGLHAEGDNGSTAITAVATGGGLAINATGDVFISGNLQVGGTITSPNAVVQGPVTMTAQAQQLMRRAARMRTRFTPPAP